MVPTKITGDKVKGKPRARYGGLHQKSWTALVLALTLLSEDSPKRNPGFLALSKIRGTVLRAGLGSPRVSILTD